MNQLIEESQVLSLMAPKNMEPSDSKETIIKQGYYNHFKGGEYFMDERLQMKIPYNMNEKNELFVNGKLKYFI